MDQLVITPAGLLEILSQIEELQGLEIEVVESPEGSLKLSVGDSTYVLKSTSENTVDVPAKVLEEVDIINQEAYDDLAYSGSADLLQDAVTSGLLKEIVKTLAIGGLVRLAKRLLKS